MRTNFKEKSKMNKKKTMEQLGETDKFRAMLEKTGVNDNNTGKYLVAIICSLILGIGGLATILWIRPEYDPVLVAGIIFAFLTPTTTSLLSFMKAGEAKEQARETHLSVNSRLDKFIEQASIAARAEGMDVGRKEANDRTDALQEHKKQL